MFGYYWHSMKITGISDIIHERKRRLHFKKYKYECLIIWEHELKNFKPLVRKIRNFM